jgi:hypothetical protein
MDGVGPEESDVIAQQFVYESSKTQAKTTNQNVQSENSVAAEKGRKCQQGCVQVANKRGCPLRNEPRIISRTVAPGKPIRSQN